MNFDYETLRFIWWVLLVFTVLGLMLSEGISLGVSMLLTLDGKSERDRRNLLAGITPTALGQLAWLTAAALLLFAAWPIVYAVFFSSLQSLLLLMLLAWLVRPLGLYFRTAFDSLAWRRNWDKALGGSGLLIAAMLGVVCGNALKGVPFHLDSDMRIFFLGDFWGLLNPFSLLIAAVSVCLVLMYGASFTQLKSGGNLSRGSQAWVFKAGIGFLLLFALAGLWVTRLEGYHITSNILPGDASNPLNKFVKRAEGLWLDNYEHVPSLWAIPVIAFLAGGATIYWSKIQRAYWAFMASMITVAFTVLTMAISMFPFLLPSNRSLNSSLTIWDASGSQATLTALLWVAVIALPLMALASRWAFCFSAGNVDDLSIEQHQDETFEKPLTDQVVMAELSEQEVFNGDALTLNIDNRA
jgi:cytochrome d ubiquinol oxidase subunit II